MELTHTGENYLSETHVSFTDEEWRLGYATSFITRIIATKRWDLLWHTVNGAIVLPFRLDSATAEEIYRGIAWLGKYSPHEVVISPLLNDVEVPIIQPANPVVRN